MATGSEQYAGVNMGRTKKVGKSTAASRRTTPKRTGETATFNGFPIF